MTLSKQLVFLLIFSLLFGCGRKESDDGVGVTVVPTFFQLPSGGEVQLSADVSGTLNKAVTWEVNGPLGTSISSGGLFRAPLNSGGQTATVRAISQDDPNVFGNAAVAMTSFSKETGETVSTGSDLLIVGGYTVRAGQTIDLNGDNLLDLISVNHSGGLAAVYLGVGGAKFLKKDEIQANKPSATVGDFINSNDFVADLAVASRSEQVVRIISGRAGSAQDAFPAAVAKTLFLSPQTPSALAAGRFHGDVESRNSDLVVGTEEGSIILLLQDRSSPSNDFIAQPAIPVGGEVVQMVSADFNGDDLLDLAVLRRESSDVLILLGNGAGTLNGPISIQFASAPTSFAVGDFNDDEINDLAAAHFSSSQVSISLGKGDGTFEPPRFTSVESAPTSISVGDFNLEGRTDIAVALPDSRAVLLLFGDGTGNLIGNFRYDTGVPPLSLVPGFFTSFQASQGFQSVGLIYIGSTENKFHLLNNVSF